MHLDREQIAERINCARDPHAQTAPLTHGFLLERRPVLRPACLFLATLLLAFPIGIAAEVQIDDRWWTLPLFTGGASSLAMNIAMHTRYALGIDPHGAGAIARYSAFRWSRKPCKRIVETFTAHTALHLEHSPPWWRKPKITIDGQTWHVGYEAADHRWLSPEEEHVDFQTLERWVANRCTPILTA